MIWSGIWLSRARLAHNTWIARRRSRGGTRQRAWLGVLLGAALATFITTALIGLFADLVHSGADASLGAAALAMILTATLVGLIAFDLHEVVATLVLDSDLELLRRAPARPAAIFALKLIDALPRTVALLGVLALPAMIAYAASYGMAPWGWTLMPLALLSLWGVALGTGVAVAMLLLRAVPARSAREVLGLLSALAIFALWMVNAFVLPRIVAESESPAALLGAIAAHPSLGFRLSPGTAIAAAIHAASVGSAGDALRALVVVSLEAAAALGLAAIVASNHLERVQARIVGATHRASRARTRRPRFARRPGFLAAMLRRDARLFRRDWTVLGDVIVASVLWTLLPLLVTPLYDLHRTLLAQAMLLGLTVAQGYEVGARAIPFERGGIAWIGLAPVTPGRWLAGRALSTLVIAAPIVAVATLAVSVAMRLDAREIAQTLALVIPALALALAIGLWTGSTFGNPEWTNPRAMLTTTGRALATLLLIVQATAWFGVAGFMSLAPGARYVPALVAALLVPMLLSRASTELHRRSWC